MNYTFEQIIFGLRKEYLEVEKQLAELKQYIDVSNKVDDYYFHIAGYPSKLFLYLNKKKNLLEKIELSLNQYILGVTNFDVTKGVNDNYYSRKKVICTINNKEELNKKIAEFIHTDFFMQIAANNYVSIPCNENKTNTILIGPGHIGLINRIDGDYPHLDYYPRKDALIIMNKEKNITPEDILNILNLSLDRNYLNYYHHRVLDNYEEKEIDIEDSFTSNKVELEIIDEPKKLILRPKKNI